MKAKLLLVIGLQIFISISIKAQIKIIGTGNVGVGNISNPVSLLELANNKWFRLNSQSSSSGILFYESGSSTPTSIQYGAEMSYDGLNDVLRLGTVENTIFKGGIYIKRATGNTCIGGIPTTAYKLEVQGTTWISGELKLGGSSSFPRPRLKFDPNSPALYPILEDLPTYSTGSLGTSVQKWQTVYGMQFYANTVLLTSDERLKENINTLDFSLSKIMRLRPVSFDFKPTSVPENPEYKLQIEAQNDKGKNKTGFIAQELIEVIPEAVEYSAKDDLYYIDYIAIIPQLVKSIQEQQEQINGLKNQVESLKKALGTRYQ